MLILFKKFNHLLSTSERRRLFVLLFLISLMAVLETIGIGSVIPVLAVIGQPTLVEENATLFAVYNILSFNNIEKFTIFLCFFSVFCVVFANLFKMIVTYALNGFVHGCRHSISLRLLSVYLNQPYEFFLNRHSSEIGSNILSEVDQFSGNFLLPLLQVVASFITSLLIIIFLMYVDFSLMVILSATFITVYLGLFLILRGFLKSWGETRLNANAERFRVAADCISGIKLVKLFGVENLYASKFEMPSKEFSEKNTLVQTISQVPRFIAEAVTVGTILSIGVFTIIKGGGVTSNAIGEMLPILGLFAFGAMRLLPVSQAVYQGLAHVIAGTAILETISSELNKKNENEIRYKEDTMVPEINFKNSFGIKNLSYKYPTAEQHLISNLSLKIKKNHSIGIVGTTGAGKTTLVDILLGLLKPNSGYLFVDSLKLENQHMSTWRSKLGYVPQEIFLIEGSIKENITFGSSLDEHDDEYLERCARIAELHDFVVNELPKKYDTNIGERGVRLSGGQRQRIGIARALYSKPEILILDEATSALDNITEKNVVKNINNLSERKTVIIIAHRITTIKDCDQIFVLDKGGIIGRGKYDYLIKKNEDFQKLALKTIRA